VGLGTGKVGLGIFIPLMIGKTKYHFFLSVLIRRFTGGGWWGVPCSLIANSPEEVNIPERKERVVFLTIEQYPLVCD